LATAEQIKALLKSHLDGDDSHFFSVAMQLAAHEAKQGHGLLAQEIRTLIDEAKKKRSRPIPTSRPVPLAQPKGELSSLLAASYPKYRLADMVLDKKTIGRLTRIIKEQRQLSKIRSHGLVPRKKLLLVGPPGTGKTMSASMLAGELGLPLLTVRLDNLITKYMGETAAKLRLIFDAISQSRGVYLFDEFDSIGSQRGQVNDVGEVRRILNSFLQMIEQDESDSVIVAATNHPDILDYALFRRFDDVIEFSLPPQPLIEKLLKDKLSAFQDSQVDWNNLAKKASGLSYADISAVCGDALKDAIINDRDKVDSAHIMDLLAERKAVRNKRPA